MAWIILAYGIIDILFFPYFGFTGVIYSVLIGWLTRWVLVSDIQLFTKVFCIALLLLFFISYLALWYLYPFRHLPYYRIMDMVTGDFFLDGLQRSKKFISVYTAGKILLYLLLTAMIHLKHKSRVRVSLTNI